MSRSQLKHIPYSTYSNFLLAKWRGMEREWRRGGGQSLFQVERLKPFIAIALASAASGDKCFEYCGLLLILSFSECLLPVQVLRTLARCSTQLHPWNFLLLRECLVIKVTFVRVRSETVYANVV